MPARGLRTYYKTLDSLSRINLLHALQTGGALTVDELAEQTGLHPNTAREHLHRLVAVGLVRSEPVLRGTRGRPVLRYRASGCDTESAPERPVARATQQLAALGEHLGRCGFAGAIDPGAHELTLRDCPFSALSEGNPQVCEVHRTLIADALRASSGPVRAGRLRRLVTERECTLELTREQATTTSSSDLP
ncbi:MAG: helix-turn-helix transcriptional regulator [Protaetiibacter sp.]